MKKGDLASPIVMWMAVLSVALIVIPWFADNIRPLSGEAQIIESDIRAMQDYVNNACNSLEYSSTYNPETNEGYLLINGSEMCIEAYQRTTCGELACSPTSSYNISLADIITVDILMNESLACEVEEFEQ